MTKRRSGRGHGPAMVNLRLRPPRGHRPTADECRAVMREILDSGTVREGWAFAGIAWKNPGKHTARWVVGVVPADDLATFAPVIAAALDTARIGVVPRHDVNPNAERGDA